MEKDEVILVKGNHEDCFCDLVTTDTGLPYGHHVHNGTYQTALDLTGYDTIMAGIRRFSFAEAGRKTPYYTQIIPSMLDYYEITDEGISFKEDAVREYSEEENYKIESEFTKFPVIRDKIWYNIAIKILPVKHKIKKGIRCLAENGFSEKMQIMIYVNGKLVLVSKEIPMLNLKKLNDLNDKQQGVPFNISLGGGTQGLAEVVYLNYKKLPEYILPLEKEFGGSFVGWLKSFRFYTCPLNYAEVVKNYNFAKKNDIYY